MRRSFGWPIGRVIPVVLATALASSAMVGAPAAAVVPVVTFGLSIGSCTVSGEAPPNLAMRLVHQDSSGHRLGRADVQVESDGDWSIACLPGGAIKSGHRLVAKDGAMTLRTLVVPPLSINIDRATDVLRVGGPPSRELHFVLDSCMPGYVACYGRVEDFLLQTDGTGKYQTTLAFDARGGDRVRLEWDTSTDYFERRQVVPYLQLERGSSRVKGRARPGTTVHVKLKRSDGTIRGTAADTADPDGGAVSARIRRNGSTVEVGTGNRIKGDHASNGVLDVVATGVTVNLAFDTAQGTCIPDGRYGVRFQNPESTIFLVAYGVLGPAGTFHASDLELVQSGWVVRLWCASPKGDVIYRRSIVP